MLGFTGDISPQTTAGKLFTIAYIIIIGIGIFVALICEVASHIIQANREQSDDSGADE